MCNKSLFEPNYYNITRMKVHLRTGSNVCADLGRVEIVVDKIINYTRQLGIHQRITGGFKFGYKQTKSSTNLNNKSFSRF